MNIYNNIRETARSKITNIFRKFSRDQMSQNPLEYYHLNQDHWERSPRNYWLDVFKKKKDFRFHVFHKAIYSTKGTFCKRMIFLGSLTFPPLSYIQKTDCPGAGILGVFGHQIILNNQESLPE